MTDQQRRLALKALGDFRARLDGNPHGFEVVVYATADAEPAGERGGFYVFQLKRAINGFTGFVLADAVYPIADSADLARAVAIAQGWKRAQAERRRVAERNGRKRKRRRHRWN